MTRTLDMSSEASIPRLTRAEQETQSEAQRLRTLVDDALMAVAVKSNDSISDLDASADRIERAARDLSVALRELARERQGLADQE
jgi:predicted  nucleic acid-binding Zn-ribbon protein